MRRTSDRGSGGNSNHETSQALLATALLSVLITIAIPPRICAAAAETPNIVFILADDLGYGDLGCQNPESKIPTPNLDKFAAQGIRFTDAHSPSAVCSPTRYGVLTGRYCWRTRLNHGVLGSFDKTLIEPGRLTVPAMLKKHGYVTAALGKWHLGWGWPTSDGNPPNPDGWHNLDFTKPITDGPITRGFDYYFGTDVPNYPPFCFIENDRTVGMPSVPKPKEMMGRPGPMLPGWELVKILPTLTDKAVDYVERAGKARPRTPFFLYFALTAPHFPIVPAPEFLGKSKAGVYGDFVVQVDWTVGQVVAALQRSGLADNTLVIVTSDNGPEVIEIPVGAYERVRQSGHSSMGPLRGVKRDTWEGGHRVPFVARWPGHIPAGTTNDEVICLVDLLATSAAIVGEKLPNSAGEDSYNVLPALLGQKSDKPLREATVLHGENGKFAIRQGDWVLIDAPDGDGNKEPDWFKKQRGYEPHLFPGELYDLRQDLSQRRNLYGEQPDIAEKLLALLGKYKARGRSTPVR